MTRTKNAQERYADAGAAPRPRRPDDGSRVPASADKPSQVLAEFGAMYSPLTELEMQLQDAMHWQALRASAESQGCRVRACGEGDPHLSLFHSGDMTREEADALNLDLDAERPGQVDRPDVGAVKAAIAEQVAVILGVLRRVAAAARRRGFRYIASQLDDKVAEVESSAALSSKLWILGRIEWRDLPKLREDLHKAEFEAATTAVDREPIPDPIQNADLAKRAKLQPESASDAMRAALRKAGRSVRKVMPGHVREWSHVELKAAAPYAVGRLGACLRPIFPGLETGWKPGTSEIPGE